MDYTDPNNIIYKDYPNIILYLKKRNRTLNELKTLVNQEYNVWKRFNLDDEDIILLKSVLYPNNGIDIDFILLL